MRRSSAAEHRGKTSCICQRSGGLRARGASAGTHLRFGEAQKPRGQAHGGEMTWTLLGLSSNVHFVSSRSMLTFVKSLESLNHVSVVGTSLRHAPGRSMAGTSARFVPIYFYSSRNGLKITMQRTFVDNLESEDHPVCLIQKSFPSRRLTPCYAGRYRLAYAMSSSSVYSGNKDDIYKSVQYVKSCISLSVLLQRLFPPLFQHAHPSSCGLV